MVAHLVRLKLALLRGGLRSSVWKVVGLVLGAVYAVLVVVLAVAGLVALGVQDDRELPRTVLTLAGTVLVAGWWMLPLVAFGVDSTLDPARFRLFPIPRRRLLLGLALAGLVGLPGIATLLITLATPLAWWREPAALPTALVGGLLGTAICVVGSRAVTTVLAPLVTGRRFREVAAVLAVVPLVLAGPIVLGVGAGLAAVADALPTIAVVAGWTPVGAPWAMAADVADGAWLAAAAKLLIGLVTLVVLTLVWDRALAAALVRPEGGGRVARSTGLGFFERVRATPTGAVAARSLTYWVRDSRYSASVAVVPVMVLMLWFLGRGSSSLLGAGVLVAFIMGWVSSADVSTDGTAFWQHVAAPLTGRADRAGRALAGLAVGGLVVLVVDVVVLAVTGRWADAPALLGMSVGVLTTGLGASAVYSARVVHPVRRPGESPFATPQGTSFAVMVSQTAGALTLLVLCLPTIVLGAVAISTGNVVVTVLAAVVGPVLGGGAMVAGIRTGARIYDRRAPELLQSLRSFA